MRRDLASYWLFVVTGFAQLAAFALLGESHMTLRGIVPVTLMVAWLGRRSRTAWWIFLIANLWLFTAALALVIGSRGPGSNILWGDVITALVGTSALLIILLSRPMKVWTCA